MRGWFERATEKGDFENQKTSVLIPNGAAGVFDAARIPLFSHVRNPGGVQRLQRGPRHLEQSVGRIQVFQHVFP